MQIEKTGFCWSCGLQCQDYFCGDKCKKSFERKKSVQEIPRWKKDNYGVKGV